MTDSVVVGGGICGLLAAYLLKKKGHNVTLIEQAQKCGGLLNSVHDSNNIYYDQGTHIPNPTGVEQLDKFLFGSAESREADWHYIPVLKTGNFLKGSWDLETQTIDARKLERDKYERGLGQLISNTTLPSDTNIEDYCKNSVGEIFFNELVRPVIDKLYGPQEDYTKLTAKNSINYFGATRLLALDSKMTASLKKLSVYDTRLGFHKRSDFQVWCRQEGIEEPSYLYPRSEKGCQYWVDDLVKKVTDSGVNILNNAKITGLKTKDKQIREIQINGEYFIQCDWVYWSAPPAFALKFLLNDLNGYRPKLRTANIFHFTLDKPLLNTESHYLWNWDSSSEIFRITLYPNLNDTKKNSITAEVLSDAEQADSISKDKIFEDLIAMQLIDPESNIVSSIRQTIHNTFPVPTHEFSQHVTQQFEQLHSLAENVKVSGRFGGKLWLLNDILLDTFKGITNQFGSIND